MPQQQGLTRRDAAGFTLVELMVVVAIIAILAAIAVPKLTAFLKNAHTAAATENMGRISQYVEAKHSINGSFTNIGNYYVVSDNATVPGTGTNISKLIGVELESGHEWAYSAKVDVTGKQVNKICIMAENVETKGAANGKKRYILYSKSSVPANMNWDDRFWKLSFLSDGEDETDKALGDCDLTPGAITWN